MTALERIGTGITIAAALIGIGAAWNSIGTRFDRLEEKISRIDDDRTKGLCLAIMNSQIKAIEAGKDKVRDQLQGLTAAHCPTPAPSDVQVASATRPMSEEEFRQETARREAETNEAIRQLQRINDELAAYINAS